MPCFCSCCPPQNFIPDKKANLSRETLVARRDRLGAFSPGATPPGRSPLAPGYTAGTPTISAMANRGTHGLPLRPTNSSPMAISPIVPMRSIPGARLIGGTGAPKHTSVPMVRVARTLANMPMVTAGRPFSRATSTLGATPTLAVTPLVGGPSAASMGTEARPPCASSMGRVPPTPGVPMVGGPPAVSMASGTPSAVPMVGVAPPSSAPGLARVQADVSPFATGGASSSCPARALAPTASSSDRDPMDSVPMSPAPYATGTPTSSSPSPDPTALAPTSLAPVVTAPVASAAAGAADSAAACAMAEMDASLCPVRSN